MSGFQDNSLALQYMFRIRKEERALDRLLTMRKDALMGRPERSIPKPSFNKMIRPDSLTPAEKKRLHLARSHRRSEGFASTELGTPLPWENGPSNSGRGRPASRGGRNRNTEPTHQHQQQQPHQKQHRTDDGLSRTMPPIPSASRRPGSARPLSSSGRVRPSSASRTRRAASPAAERAEYRRPDSRDAARPGSRAGYGRPPSRAGSDAGSDFGGFDGYVDGDDLLSERGFGDGDGGGSDAGSVFGSDDGGGDHGFGPRPGSRERAAAGRRPSSAQRIRALEDTLTEERRSRLRLESQLDMLQKMLSKQLVPRTGTKYRKPWREKVKEMNPEEHRQVVRQDLIRKDYDRKKKPGQGARNPFSGELLAQQKRRDNALGAQRAGTAGVRSGLVVEGYGNANRVGF